MHLYSVTKSPASSLIQGSSHWKVGFTSPVEGEGIAEPLKNPSPTSREPQVGSYPSISRAAAGLVSQHCDCCIWTGLETSTPRLSLAHLSICNRSLSQVVLFIHNHGIGFCPLAASFPWPVSAHDMAAGDSLAKLSDARLVLLFGSSGLHGLTAGCSFPGIVSPPG